MGLYHWRNGNAGGALTMLDRGRKRLARYADLYLGLDLGALRPAVLDVRGRVLAGEPFPEDLASLPRYLYRAPAPERGRCHALSAVLPASVPDHDA